VEHGGEDDFAAYARARQHHLYRTAYLLCGDSDRAQDLVQTTLANVLRSWRKASQAENPDAYAKTVLVRVFLSEQRKHYRESAAHRLAAGADAEGPGQADLRIVVLEALRTLPPKPRAMIILRYWEDQSVEDTAALMNCSTGNVKSQCSRALAKLRELLGDQYPVLAEP
jgi:RNA polymerase sigma-70 factor (sigma-E family)